MPPPVITEYLNIALSKPTQTDTLHDSHLDDSLGEGLREFGEQFDLHVGRLVEGEGAQHGLAEGVEVASEHLNRQEDGHAEPVEDVVHSGSGEGTLELVAVTHL